MVVSVGSVTVCDLAAAPVGEVPASGEVGDAGEHDDDVTLDRYQLIHEMCADDGIDVKYKDLGDNRRGEWDWKVDVIRISPRLTRTQETASVAHELAHRRLGDRCSTPPVERRAWEFAAAMLILPAEYAEAERRVGHNPKSLALELGVTDKVIEAWQRWYEHRCPEWLRLDELAARDDLYGA